MKTPPTIRSTMRHAMVRLEKTISYRKRPAPNAQHPISNAEALSFRLFEVRHSAFDVCFISLFQPFFPAALEHKDVFKLRFIAQASRDLAAGVAALAAAVNNDFFLRRPFL